MKPTEAQFRILAALEIGEQITATRTSDDVLDVHSFQWSRDGQTIVAHRTVLRDDACGDPRLDFRTELYRIERNGKFTRL